jgi:hypothetical protein
LQIQESLSLRDSSRKIIYFCLFRRLGTGVSRKLIQRRVVEKRQVQKKVPLGETTPGKLLIFTILIEKNQAGPVGYAKG